MGLILHQSSKQKEVYYISLELRKEFLDARDEIACMSTEEEDLFLEFFYI